MSPIELNVSLFAHIELDSELSGRYGVQGNVFANTFGYLNQYLQTLHHQPLRIRKLTHAMQSLISREQAIQETKDQASLDAFVVTNTANVLALKRGENCLLPGGWEGIDSPGHAMIYQFERDGNGQLLFSIYNAGAGLQYHEKTSSFEKELYSPVKVYALPEPVDLRELQSLVKTLVVPQLSGGHPERNNRKFDEKTLYESIETVLPFLQAQPILQNLDTLETTTAGQLSGTCAQRSIHQMLKLNFGDLPEYQRFIFDFKMYALDEFIKTHPYPPRSPGITAFIQKAIINNLRILQQESLFETSEEYDAAKEKLLTLQKEMADILPSEAQIKTAHPSVSISTKPKFSGLNQYFQTNVFKAPSLSKRLEDWLFPKNSRLPQWTLRQDNLLDDLDTFITLIQKEKYQNPLWAMKQIEELLLQLPIPTTAQKNQPYYDALTFYHTIKTKEQFEKMTSQLQRLQEIYDSASYTLGKDSHGLSNVTLPTQLITHASLLTLRDYFDVMEEPLTKKPTFHRYTNYALHHLLQPFIGCPYIATNNPELDLRWAKLCLLANEPYQAIYKKDDDDLYHYQQILDTEPEAKKRLEAMYQEQYGKDNSPFHIELRQRQCTALFMFTEKLEYKQPSTRSNNELPEPHKFPLLATDLFKPLLHKIHRQWRLEEFLVEGANAFLDGRYCWQKFHLKWEDDKFKIFSGSLSEHSLRGRPGPTKEKSVTHHKYNLTESSAEKALLVDYQYDGFSKESSPRHRSSNDIQLLPHKIENLFFRESERIANELNHHLIDRDDYFSRDLYHLRSSPAHQVNLTLDYFSKTEFLDKLRDANIQRYVEANLFEQSLLMATLKEDDTFLSRFNVFFQKGLRHFATSTGSLSQESIFFIRLRTYIYRYAALLNPSELHLLEKDHIYLNALIGNETDLNILTSLHHYRLLTLTTLERFSPDQNLTRLNDALLSYFYVQAQDTSSKEDMASQVELQYAFYDLKACLQKASDATIHSMITSIMHELNLEVSHFTLTGTYPVYQFQEKSVFGVFGTTVYTINVEQGHVFQEGRVLCHIPMSIRNHPVAAQLNLKDASCFASEDGNTFLFPQHHIRMQKDQDALIVQKKWTINGHEQWYQLQPLTPTQQKWFGLDKSNLPSHTLPPILTDATTEAWVTSDHTIIVQNHCPIYEIDHSGIMHQLNQQGLRFKPDRIYGTYPPLYESLTQFENPGFVTVNLDVAGEQGTIDFARYDLTLSVQNKQLMLANTSYILDPSIPSPFGSEVASLQLRDGVHTQCIVAVQPFYADSKTPQIPGEYYQLTHDTSGKIPDELLKKYWEAKNITEQEPIWAYRGGSKTIRYNLIDGQPKPNNAADALYLCYLYLSTHEVDKAWAVLNDMNKRFSIDGSMEELTYLSWIVEALPVLLLDEKLPESRLKLQTPEYVACQLKAVGLYTDFLKLNTAPVLTQDKTHHLTQANADYDELCFEKMKAFYNNLPGTVYNLYSRHQQGRRHLHEKYHLNDDTCKSLLNYCDMYQSDKAGKPIARGALGYERRRLSLKTLLQEYRRLEILQNTADVLPPNFENRISNIRKQITNELEVAKKSTTLERVAIDLTIPHDFKINETLLSSKSKTVFDAWKNMRESASDTERSTALNALSSDITQDEFIQNFSTYLNVIRSGDSAQKAALEDFCKKYLVAHRHVPLDKQETVIPYLTNLLYRALSNERILRIYGFNFDRLRGQLSEAYIPDIEIYQAKDVYHEILTDNQAIWDELYNSIPHQSMMPILEPIYSKSLTTQLGIDEQCKSYRQVEVDYQRALSEFIKMRDSSSAEVVNVKLAEQRAGELQYQCLQMQQRIAKEVLSSSGTRSMLLKKADALGREQKKHLSTLWKRIDSLANQSLRDPSHPYHMQLAAEQRNELTHQELLSLYLHADRAQYMEKTGLSDIECEKLHQLIHEGLSLEVNNQQVLRLLEALNRAGSEPNLSDLYRIADTLMAENDGIAQSDPTLMLFQYAENKLLRPRQIAALNTLLSTPDDPYRFNQSIEKIIMGGGKSKVILPLLAAKKATGLNLVVVEVPPALLATNHADLNSTSQRLFGQKAHRFEFNRDSDCSPKRLETIYHTFVDVMTNKEYLVTTGEAMQSLELKYLELLLFPPEDPKKKEGWEKQVYWASKISSLLKQNGDVVIDEVHQSLLLKKKLNYTVGDGLSISPELIRHSIALYRFIEAFPQQALTPELLVTHPQSPLMHYIERFKREVPSEEVEQQLLAYLHNQTESGILNQSSDEIKDAFAFYKEQLTLYPQTKSRHYKEHYGPSIRQSSALKRALAIPYIASNKPNERSRFGNPLEIINYTIQSLLIDGVNENLLKEIIIQWQNEAKQELLTSADAYSCINETPTAKRINTLFKGTNCSLQTINVHQDDQLNRLSRQLRHQKDLLFTLLEEKILTQIVVQPSILHSDAYNHVDIYRSKQGISGTPSNYTTYHQDFQYNQNTSLGLDGYIQTLLKEKETPIHEVKFNNLDTFLSTLLSGKENVRAIIDVNATFAGMNNFDVASHLARHAVHQNSPKPVEYILYFNEEDVLCAYHVTNQKTVILATSDPNEIDQKLGCTAESRLTYYDQSHTIGTDLTQPPMAHGIVLADGETHLQSFLQGCMRMRGLENQQTISIVVPENTPSSLDALMDLMSTKEQKQIQEDNFFAAIAKMNNVIRQEALKCLALIDENNINEKHEMAYLFKDYFIETHSQKIFEQYGGIYVEQETASLLSQHRIALMEHWKKCAKKSTFGLDLNEAGQLDVCLQKIVETSIPLCKPMSMSRLNQTNGREVEQETIHEVLVEKEMMKEEICFDTKKCEQERHRWVPTVLSSFLTEGSTSFMHSLNHCCSSNEDSNISFFSPTLLVDDNYAKVYEGQDRMLCPYLKPVHAILFRKYGETLSACLITMTDADELHQHLNNVPPGVDAWISTTQHTVLEGTFPEGMLDNPNYQSLIEQIRFFNGECNGLCEQKSPFQWLNQESGEKLDYLQKNIMPYRQTTTGELRHLKKILTKQEGSLSVAAIIPTALAMDNTLKRKQLGMRNDLQQTREGSEVSSSAASTKL